MNDRSTVIHENSPFVDAIAKHQGHRALSERGILARILDLMFWASLGKEEGREIRGSVCFGTPNGYSDATAVSLVPPRPLGKDLLIELMTACPTGALVVDLDGADQPVVWGMDFFRVFVDLSIRIAGPGVLVATLWNEIVAIFRDGEVAIPQLQPYTSFLTVLEECLTASGMATDAKVLSSSLTKLLTPVFQRGHGAMFLVVPPNDPTWHSHVDIRFPIANTQGKPVTLARQAEEEFQKRLNDSQSLRMPPEPDDDYFYDFFQTHYHMQSASTRATAVFDFIAHLASVDGAVVVSHDLEVAGFGVKIKSPNPPRDSILLWDALELSTPTKAVKLTAHFKGTRHLSAARFAANNQKSLVFAVSQDRRLTLFAMQMAFTNLQYLLPV